MNNDEWNLGDIIVEPKQFLKPRSFIVSRITEDGGIIFRDIEKGIEYTVREDQEYFRLKNCTIMSFKPHIK